MSSNAVFQEGQKLQVKKVRKIVSMLLCNSCYWCASALYDTEPGGKCPCCAQPVESIPLQEGEMFTFDYDTRTGVILEFKRPEN